MHLRKQPTISRMALIASVLLSSGGPAIRAQPAATPKFEVASVRLSPNCVQPRPGPFPKGRLTIPCLTVRNMIQVSYGTYGLIRNPRIQIVDGPAWYSSDKFDLAAKAESDDATVEQMMGPMLRALLEERFGLRTHKENRDLPVYTLMVAKNGPKIQPTKEGSCSVGPAEPGQPLLRPCGSSANRGDASARVLDVWGANIADFLHGLIFMYLDRPVIDKTELAGKFDYHLEFSTDNGPAAACSSDCPPGSLGPSVFTAFQDQLGLKLTAATGPVEVLVIDHIEKPSEN